MCVLSYLLISQAKEAGIMSRVAHKPALEETNVDDGGIEVDKLKQEDLEYELVLKLCLCSVHL